MLNQFQILIIRFVPKSMRLKLPKTLFFFNILNTYKAALCFALGLLRTQQNPSHQICVYSKERGDGRYSMEL